MSDQERGQGLGRSGSTSSSHRTILPRNYSEEAQRGARADGPSQAQSESSKKGPTSRQRVACANCQKRKSKCDGNQPCGRCASASQTCVYESDVGVPRTQALKRKNEALHEDNSQLKYIVQGLRYGTAEEATEILRRIRSTNNAEEAVVAISEASLLVKPTWADLPAFGPLQQGQTLPHSASEILASSTALTRSRSDARPAAASGPSSANPANSSSPTTARGLRDSLGILTEPLGGRSSGAPLSDFIHRVRNSSERRSSSASTTTTQSRPTMRWTPWPPSANTRMAAGTANPLGIADRLNQLCDGFPYIDQSHDRLLPVPDNAVLYLWNANTPAHSWTTVTDDAELVAGLCTQFFMWEQPFYNYINRSAFLEDMCSVGPGPDSDPDTREFCSPALVNAICALGCMSSRHPGAFKYPGDLRSRGHHFIEEAERIIRKEELETPRLSTMQAIWMVMWFRGAAGQRFLTSEFSERFYWMYDQLQLGKAFQRPKEYDYNPRAKLYWDALSEAIWGFYCQDCLHSIANGGPARMKRPLIEKTFGRHSRGAIKIADLWWPCPDPQRTENSLIEETLDYKCDLTDITRKMLAFVNSIQEKVRGNELGMDIFWEAYDLYDEFVHWKESIPDAFAPGGSCLPHVLLLQASYDIAIITLFRPLQQMTPDPAAFITQSRGHKHREVLHPRTYVVTHSMNVLGIMNNFRTRWTFYRHCYTSQCHWLPAFALLFYLRQGEASTDTFTSAVRGLRETGQKWNVAIWMLQSIKGLAQKFDITLPPRSGKYFRDLEFEAPRRGPDATDVMIPVTIPAEFRAQDSGLFPFPDAKEVGTYVQNLDSVLDQMGVVNLAMPN